MADRLINILEFANVAAGDSVAAPHLINAQGRSMAPDFVAFTAAGFTAVVTETTCTITNTGDETASVFVWLELKHSIQRAFGGVQNQSLTPRPFIASGGGGGGSFFPNRYSAQHVEWNDDWMLSNQLAQGNGWNGIPIGAAPYSLTLAGTQSSVSAVTGTQRIGVCRLATGNTNAGYAALSTAATLSNLSDLYTMFIPSFEWVGGVPTLSTALEEFQCEIGLVGNAPGYRVSWRYDRANFGDFWCAVTQEAGGPEDITVFDGGGGRALIPVLPVTYPNTNLYRLKVVYDAKNLATWLLDGAEVHTSIAELPTHSLAGSFDILKTVGTTTRELDTDFTSLACDFAPARIP